MKKGQKCMWKYNETISPDELYHHKYIAKIGSGKDARYFYSQSELDAYKKAFSSKDELNDAYAISQKHRGEVGGLKSDISYKYDKKTKSRNIISDRRAKEKVIENNLGVLAKRKNSNWINADRYSSIYELKTKDQQSSTNKDYAELKRASDNYAEAKTVKGKMKAAKKVFDQYHPETANRIKRGRKKLKKLFG